MSDNLSVNDVNRILDNEGDQSEANSEEVRLRIQSTG